MRRSRSTNWILIVVALAFVLAFPFLEATVWNGVIPNIFKGAPTIDYWGAFGLSLVLSIFSGPSAVGSRRK